MRERTMQIRVYESTHDKLMKMLAKRLRAWEKEYKQNSESPKPWIADIIKGLVNDLEAVKGEK